MTITINRRKLAFWGVLILVAAGLMVGAFWFRGQQTAAAAKANAPVPPEQIVVAFTRDFYTLDYRDKTGWLAKLQPECTQDGYTFLNDMLTPLLWPQLTKSQSVTSAAQITVKDNGLKALGQSNLGQWQIRAVSVTIAPEVKWPDAHEFDTNVLLGLENGAWKFGMFMDDASADIYAQRATPAP